MKAEPHYPIAAIHGSLTKDHYCRILNGQQIIQRKPVRNKPPTERQLAVREVFRRVQMEKHARSVRARGGIVVVS